MKQQIVEYQIQWNVTSNTGHVTVKLQQGNPHSLPINSAAEFIAVTQMLSKSPVYIDTQTGEMTCGPRPVGT
jgi:hypothetical protein